MTQHEHAARVANEQHMVAARRQAPVLVARTRQLIRNGADLSDPARFADFFDDQVHDAVKDSTFPDCPGGPLVAALALSAELARQLAEATR